MISALEYLEYLRHQPRHRDLMARCALAAQPGSHPRPPFDISSLKQLSPVSHAVTLSFLQWVDWHPGSSWNTFAADWLGLIIRAGPNDQTAGAILPLQKD